MRTTKFAALSLTLALCSYSSQAQNQIYGSQQPSNPSPSRVVSTMAPSGPNASRSLPVNSSAIESPAESSSVDSGRIDVDNAGAQSALADAPSVTRFGSRSGAAALKTVSVRHFPRFALGIRISTLGTGIEMATPLSRSLNLRAAVNYAPISYAFNLDGIDYSTNVNFRSGQIGIDWFPRHRGFHISPGFMYFRHSLNGEAHVPPGETFSLGDTTYINSVDDPVSGTASVTFKQHLAPVLTVGWGNIIPRSGRHLSVPFEIGAAYTGAGLMNIKLAGTACTTEGCFNAATDPDTQANLQSQIRDLNDQVKKFQFYPIISLGFAYRF